MSGTDVDCSDFHSLHVTDVCGFVQNTSSCQIDEGFVNYTTFLYCTLGSVSLVASCILLLIWWLFLFCGLAVTADDFFCPQLAVISQNLKLSHNVAGVTFLAFGNGAPDIFSSIAAIGSAQQGNAGLAIGALFGAGVFVTAVVAGSIAIIHPFTCMQRPFLRDVIFYLSAVYWAFVVMWDKVIYQWEAVGFIILYAVYVLVVIVGRYINQKWKQRARGSFLEHVLDDDDRGDNEKTRLLKEIGPSPDSIQREICYYEEEPNFELMSIGRILWRGINPINTEEWSEMKFYAKIYECFKCPLVLLLKLTVPIVDVEEDVPSLRNWNRPLNSLHVTTAPMFVMFSTKLGFNLIGGVFPVWALVLIITPILSIIVFVTSKTSRRPFYHTLYAYLGFFAAFVWIYSIANEVVNILQALGVVFNLSDAILGLTLLAWGNSIGDLISDTSMARQGYPRMGISACFGGPLFNLLLGLGIPFTIATVKNGGEPYKLAVDLEEIVLAGGLATSLVFSMIVVTFSGFKMSRPYGISLIVLYVCFLIIAVLTEVDVIKNVTL